MADSPFAGLGLEFMRWQNAPSLTGGLFEKFAGGAKKALLAKAAESTGLVDYLDSIGKQPTPVAPPVQSNMMAPVPPVVGVAPQIAPIPQLGQPTETPQEEPQDYNLMIWGKR